MTTATNSRKRVVIVGAGFAGLAVMRGLRNSPVDVVIIDRHNYHLFQPLLYQVASALLDPSAIAYPVRAVARRQRNANFRLAEVTGIDIETRKVRTSKGDVDYDFLVVAAGARSNFFGIAGLEERSFGMKTVDEALSLRARILEQFENATVTDDAEMRKRELTFCIVGAGPSGVEYAGALSELIHLVLRKEYPEIDFKEVQVVLVEARPQVLEMFAPRLRKKAADALQHKGVRLMLGKTVSAVEDGRVLFADRTVLETNTVVWTAGVRAESIASELTKSTRSMSRVPVSSRFGLEGHDEVFVAGDMAEYTDGKGRVLPMLGGVAVQQGEYVAHCIDASIRKTPVPKAFHYRDKGTMATIGRNVAVVQIGRLRFSGRLGWITWLFVHLMLLVGFRNRVVAFVSWAWDYVFYDRPVRLITGGQRKK